MASNSAIFPPIFSLPLLLQPQILLRQFCGNHNIVAMANYSHQLHDMVTQSEMTSTCDMQVEIRAKLAHGTQQFQRLLDERTRPPGERPGAGPHFSNPNQGFQGGGSSSPKGSSSGMGVTLKIVWLELPHFNGDDPKTWCDRASQFF
jgi:hypothetical protein